MPIMLTIEVSLTSAMSSLPIAGITFLIACGKTILSRVVLNESPSARPASFCPLSTEQIPARKFSDTYAPELTPNAKIAVTTGGNPLKLKITNAAMKS